MKDLTASSAQTLLFSRAILSLAWLAWLLCAAGCDSSEKLAGNASQRDSAAAPIANELSPQPPAEDQKPHGNQKKTSPLDEAVKKAGEKPVVDPYGEEEANSSSEIVPPHEELQSFVEPHWVRLHPSHQVWLDNQSHQVIVAGQICFRDGPLEMFACPRRTKEHESVVSTHSSAEIIHIGLLATGAKPGKPVTWDPEFAPPSGPVIQVTAVWKEGDERIERKAQSMILDMRTGKAMEHPFVYCGSREWTDPDNPSYREFQADAGDLICVSNFSTALIDVGVESSQSTGSLMFHANPDQIPVLGKPVLLFLKPELSPAISAEAENGK